jgi:predicted nucleic acid-binding protein
VSFLLDVGALVALGHSRHVHHDRVRLWVHGIRSEARALATCSITEIGFVRVSAQAGLHADVRTAREALALLKRSSPIPFEFLSDSIGVDRLPGSVRRPGDLADGHLFELARANGMSLATLDSGIPGALLVPKEPPASFRVEEAAGRGGRAPRRSRSRGHAKQRS